MVSDTGICFPRPDGLGLVAVKYQFPSRKPRRSEREKRDEPRTLLLAISRGISGVQLNR